jgi:uncharacterized protein YjbJ (UPF0337 family)
MAYTSDPLTPSMKPTPSPKDVASEQGAELTGAVREQAGEVVGAAREHVGDVAHQAAGEAEQVVERTRRAVTDEARQRTDDLARSTRRFSDGLHALADGRPQDAGPVAGYVRDAAGRVEGMAERLERRGYDGLVEDVSAFARRRPGVFLASAGLLGFAVGRVLRSGGLSGAAAGTGSGRPATGPSGTAPVPPGLETPTPTQLAAAQPYSSDVR